MAFDRTDTQSAQVVPSPRTTPRVIDTWTGFCCLQAPPDRHPGPDLAVCKPTAAEFAHPTQPPPLVPPILSPTGSKPASYGAWNYSSGGLLTGCNPSGEGQF